MAVRWSPALVAIVVGGFLLTAYFTRQVTEWLVMTDEMQYVKLAIGIAGGNPIPRIHDAYFPSLNQVYPLVLAPVFGLFDMPTAFRLAHLLNAAIMASAAIPAYLLVRALPAPRAAALVGAALSVLVPYMAMALMVMTEVPGYPVFLWALLAMQRGLSDPSPRRDLIAIAAIALAVFTRTQFLVLALVYPVAVVVHELAFAVAGRSLRGLREAARRHAVLWGVAAAGLVAAVALAVAGRLSSLLGHYAVTAEGDILPPGVFRSAVYHADLVFVAVGLIPAVLGIGWALASLVAPSRKSLHAYAVLVLVIGAAMLVQVASFDLRFVGGFLQTRYLASLAPLLLIATVACCIDERRRWIGVLVAAVALSRVLPWLPYSPAPSPWFGAPDTAFHAVLTGRVYQLGNAFGFDNLTVADVLRWGTPVLGVALAVLLRAAPRRVALVAVAAVLIPYGAAQTVYVLNKITTSPNGIRPVSGTPMEGRDWVDQTVPDGASVAILPVFIADAPVPPEEAAYFSQVVWWDTEFWNKSVDQAYAPFGPDSFTDWPKPELTIDREAGRMVVDDYRRYVVVSSSAMAFRLRPTRVLADTGVLSVLEAPRGYPLEWSSQGVDQNGAVGPQWSLRVYGEDGPVARRVGFDVVATPELRRRVRFTLRSGDRTATAALAPGGTAQPRLDVCVPAGRFADVEVELRGTPAVQVRRIVTEPAPQRDC